jgi:hypothetical protein
MTSTPDKPAPRPDLARRLARLARSVYAAQRRFFLLSKGKPDRDWARRALPRWDGHVDVGTGVVHAAPIWPRLVHYALRHGAGPVGLILAAFASHAGGKPLDPDQILAQEALDAHQQCRPRRDDLRDRLRREVERLWVELCSRRAEPGMAPGDALADVLLDPVPPLSALLRFAVARAEGLPGLADHFHEVALCAYLEDPDGYADAFGPLLPEEFRREAERALQAILTSEPDPWEGGSR